MSTPYGVGYVLPPLGAKFRCDRRAVTFFIDGVHKGGAALSLPFGEDGAVLKPCSSRAQAKFCRAQNGAQNKKSRKAALLKAPFPHFLFQLVQGGQRSSQSFAAAKRQQNPALLVNKASQGGSAVALPRRAQQ